IFGLPPGYRAADVIANIWHLVDEGNWKAVNRVLVRAFLDDIQRAYRFRPRRRVNCLLLLDDIDRAHNVDPQGADLLSLLVERRLQRPDAGLLVIATKQSAPEPRTLLPEPDGADSQSPAEAAAVLFGTWHARFTRDSTNPAKAKAAAVLPLTLPAFTRDQTRKYLHTTQLFADWAGGEDELLDAFFRTTRGHPLAVDLVARWLSDNALWNRTIPLAMRTVFDEPAAAVVPQANLVGATANATIRDYLLLRFLQHFPAAPGRPAIPASPGRADIQHLLVRLSAPRRITREIIAVLIPRTDQDFPNTNPKSLISELSRYSFITRSGSGAVLHPLLRDLLARELTRAERPSSTEIHSRLRDFYSRTGEQADEIEALYQTLALGDVNAVIDTVASWIGQRDDWPQALERITEAPGAPYLDGSDEPSAAPMDGAADDGDVADAADGPEPALRRLVFLLWSLRSELPAAEPSPAATAVLLVDALAACGDGPGHAAAERYRATAARPDRGELTPTQTPFAKYEYPVLQPSRRTVRMLTGTGLTLLLLGYSAVYAKQHSTDCYPGSPHAVRAVTRTLWDQRFILKKKAGDQCIGVTAQPTKFTTSPYDPEKDWRNDVITTLWKLITEENAAAEKLSNETGHPIATVILATQLSSGQDPPQFDLAVGVNELIGTLLGMRKWNHGTTRPPEVLLRVLVANLGGESEFAVQTSHRIWEIAESDPNVIAVLGLGQTRATTVKAMEYLGRPNPDDGRQGIPMISSAQSGDQLGGIHGYFRIAPPNQLQAELGTRWLRERHPGAGAAIFVSAGDDYSTGLGGDYKRLLDAAGVSTEIVEFDAKSTHLNRDFEERIADLCDETPDNNIIIYTGRANEAVPLVEAVGLLGEEEETEQCARRTTILGGDDMTQTEETEMADALAGNHAEILFTTFGVPSAARRILPVDSRNKLEEFWCAYDKLRREYLPRHTMEPGGHMQAAYDVYGVLNKAVGTSVPDRPALTSALTSIQQYYGVTGLINFTLPESDDPRSSRREKLVVLQRLESEKGDNGRVVRTTPLDYSPRAAGQPVGLPAGEAPPACR
ncbi:ABC transporter substrate-binding protein, partial [Candidatus Protofrankia californiensis]|uniref:ABC transporter substrate-binding protein n=1 Tax=Candidatus Protofrankia californiensis TaxID=1839754 RepID=UPI0013EC1BD5